MVTFWTPSWVSHEPAAAGAHASTGKHKLCFHKSQHVSRRNGCTGHLPKPSIQKQITIANTSDFSPFKPPRNVWFHGRRALPRRGARKRGLPEGVGQVNHPQLLKSHVQSTSIIWASRLRKKCLWWRFQKLARSVVTWYIPILLKKVLQHAPWTIYSATPEWPDPFFHGFCLRDIVGIQLGCLPVQRGKPCVVSWFSCLEVACQLPENSGSWQLDWVTRHLEWAMFSK